MLIKSASRAKNSGERPIATMALLFNYISAFLSKEVFCILPHDIMSGSERSPCNKIDKPLVVYRFNNDT